MPTNTLPNRRPVVFAGIAVLGVLSLGAGTIGLAFGHSSRAAGAASPATAPSRPVDRVIDDYVLFAFDTLQFQGATTAGRGVISGGDVGANGIDAHPGDSSPVLNISANHRVTMDDGSQVVADTMRITNLCRVWDVFANGLVGGSNVAPVHAGPVAFTTPILTVPSFPSFIDNPNAPVTVAKDATVTLSPGVFGDVTIKDGAHVTLLPGTFTMRRFDAGRNVTVTSSTGTQLQITRTFSVGNGTSFGPRCDVPVYVRGDGSSGVHDLTVNFAKSTHVAGRFLTLTGTIALGHTTDLAGHFWGHKLVSDVNVNVIGCHEEPSTTTTTATTSTTLESVTTTTVSPTTTTSPGSTSTTSTTTTGPGSGTTTSTEVSPTTVIAPTTTTVPAGPPTTVPKSGSSSLPRTGLDFGLIVLGAALVAVGSIALVLHRRRTA